MRPQLPDGIQNGVIQACLLARLAQPLLVGLHVSEVQRIGRAQAGVNQLVAGLKQRVDALPRAELEVVLALGADQQIGFEIRLINGLAAAGAFHPQALGANVLRARFGPVLPCRPTRLGRILAVLALKPRHTEPNCKWMERKQPLKFFVAAKPFRRADKRRRRRSSPAAAD